MTLIYPPGAAAPPVGDSVFTTPSSAKKVREIILEQLASPDSMSVQLGRHHSLPAVLQAELRGFKPGGEPHEKADVLWQLWQKFQMFTKASSAVVWRAPPSRGGLKSRRLVDGLPEIGPSVVVRNQLLMVCKSLGWYETDGGRRRGNRLGFVVYDLLSGDKRHVELQPDYWLSDDNPLSLEAFYLAKSKGDARWVFAYLNMHTSEQEERLIVAIDIDTWRGHVWKMVPQAPWGSVVTHGNQIIFAGQWRDTGQEILIISVQGCVESAVEFHSHTVRLRGKQLFAADERGFYVINRLTQAPVLPLQQLSWQVGEAALTFTDTCESIVQNDALPAELAPENVFRWQREWCELREVWGDSGGVGVRFWEQEKRTQQLLRGDAERFSWAICGQQLVMVTGDPWVYVYAFNSPAAIHSREALVYQSKRDMGCQPVRARLRGLSRTAMLSSGALVFATHPQRQDPVTSYDLNLLEPPPPLAAVRETTSSADLSAPARGAGAGAGTGAGAGSGGGASAEMSAWPG